MKRALSLILTVMLCMSMLAGCCLSHEWVEADCIDPKTCSKCDKTEGEALGHDWEEADCVDPKTCSRCGETEGQALGHDWIEADCLTPKTCSRCAETEGEALGHSYSPWEATENETMVSTCSSCGDVQEQPVDRELIGRQQLVGKWEQTSLTLSGMWMDYSLDWTLEFREDGTFVFEHGETENGVLTYVEFYVGEHMNFYVFDGDTAESAYSFNYEPAEDAMYIIGSEFFKFTRVAE